MRKILVRRCRGMTLVEVLVSTVIISIGLIGVSQLILVSSMTFTRAKNISIATKRVEYELDQIHNLGYDGLAKDREHIVPESYPSGQYSAPEDDKVTFAVPDLPGGQGTITITQNPFGVSAGSDQNVEPNSLLSIVIKVAWSGTNGRGDNVQVTTFLSKRPTPQ